MSIFANPAFRTGPKSFDKPNLGLDLVTAVSMGRVEGASVVEIDAFDSLVAAVWHDMWEGPADKVWKTTAEAITVAAANVADDAAGARAQKVLVEYLDANYVTQFVLVPLVGAGTATLDDDGVALPDALRIQQTNVVQSGSNGEATNLGIISVNIGGSLQDRIEPEISTSTSGYYTVPAASILVVSSVTLSCADEADLLSQVRLFGGSFGGGSRVFLNNGSLTIPGSGSILFAKSDLRIRCKGKNNTTVAALVNAVKFTSFAETKE